MHPGRTYTGPKPRKAPVVLVLKSFSKRYSPSLKAVTIPAFSTEVNIIKTTLGCSRIDLRRGVVHGGEWMKCRIILTVRQMNEGLEVRNFHGDIRRFVEMAIIARPSISHFVQFVLNHESFWELFCFAIKSLGRRVSGVESQRSAVRLHVHACSSSTLWWIIEMSSPNPHVSSGRRLVPDTLMFPVVRRVCRTRCCDVVVSVPMLLTCSGDEEGEWIDFETCILYILKNFLYIGTVLHFPLLKV